MGSRDRYYQDDIEGEMKLVPEGIEGRVLSGVRFPPAFFS